jgi:hypothetical protein
VRQDPENGPNFRSRPLGSARFREFPLGRPRQPKTRPQASGAEGQWFESTRAYQIPRESRRSLGVRIPPGSPSGINVAVSGGPGGVSAPFRDFPLAQALARDLWLFEADALCSGRVDRGEAGADILSRLGQREGRKFLTHFGLPIEPPSRAPARSREQFDFA